MLCIHETFFTRDGKVTDESRLKSEIYQMIKPYVRTGVSKKVSNLLEALRSECFSSPLPIYHGRAQTGPVLHRFTTIIHGTV